MDLEKANKSIRNAWIAGLISGGITLLVTLIAIAGVKFMGFSVWNLLDVFLVFGLTYGIYSKNRVCAVIMFVYFVISKMYMIFELKSPTGLPLAIVFGYFFYQGIRGTYAYHTLIKAQTPSPNSGSNAKPS